ncbi:MAG: endonuclease/exonuclease/phosphatase family protein [Bacteroidales bacterium]|nr:endonuclease/exonuclease/phosphatase family protein [Bacteroidales bacterium]MBQ5539425.1 endonuclease/exonuclease/phosphatase family protein [Bacteroidales bacterium]
MKKIFIAVLFSLTAFAANAQKTFSLYAIGFYNQENLFDTIHDEGKNDYEYLPEGSNKWNAVKYEHKLANMSKALADMGTDMLPNVGCAVIGLAEVENSRALEDLVSQKPLKDRGIKFVHVEGPDKRGVDCAMLYNPQLFTVKNFKLVPYVYDLDEDVKKDKQTRGFLTVSGEISGEHVTVVVCHLPSRYTTSYYRELGGRQLRALKDSLQKDDPKVKIFIMGDMNDDPFDPSMTDALGARRNIQDVELFGLYNPFWNILREGTGTLMYKGAWNLFDQIIMSENLLDKKQKRDYKTLTLYKSTVFKRDYLIQQEGKYKGAPKRTSAGGVWLDGYSDHLPVVVYVIKEQKNKK